MSRKRAKAIAVEEDRRLPWIAGAGLLIGGIILAL